MFAGIVKWNVSLLSVDINFAYVFWIVIPLPYRFPVGNFTDQSKAHSIFLSMISNTFDMACFQMSHELSTLTPTV